jgi:hypothetical protein
MNIEGEIMSNSLSGFFGGYGTLFLLLVIIIIFFAAGDDLKF